MENKFRLLTSSLMGLAGFIMVLLMIFLFLGTVKQSTPVCGINDAVNETTAYLNGVCWSCHNNGTSPYSLCGPSTALTCCNSSNTLQNNTYFLTEFSGSAYNATKSLTASASIIPQFSSIIVIAMIFVAILGLIAVAGVYGYNKLK